QEFSFWDMQRMLATPLSDPHSYGDISRYAAAPLQDGTIANIVDLLANCPVRTATANGTFGSLGWVGGNVVDSVGRTATADVHRKMLTLLRPSPVWPNDAPASVGEQLMAWTNNVIEAIGTGPYESYQNFPNRAIADWKQAYYAENLARLIQVKAKYDPNNLFKNPQSIPTQ